MAKDVAEWIENKNTSQMINVIDEDEKALYTMYRVDGSTHKQWFLTEDGLYELLMQSRKPIAKEFKKEVKHSNALKVY
ncbi:BRO-N domain-containing protein [Bacillus rhizoplanae]|uniref:BRO-N domain-containing protein n=1 Tax=Bacillus rhizoplanae TaxID=2880966 RepID=UPI003D1C76F2